MLIKHTMLNDCYDLISIAEPGVCAYLIYKCTIPNYNIFYSFYPYSPGRQDRGIILYIHDRVMPHTKTIEANESSYNCKIWVKIGNTLLCCAYCNIPIAITSTYYRATLDKPWKATSTPTRSYIQNATLHLLAIRTPTVWPLWKFHHLRTLGLTSTVANLWISACTKI